MEFSDLIVEMTRSICSGDGKRAAACFTEDGIYHDVFYGDFPKPDIPRMVSDYFHRDAERFRWDVYEPMSDERIGYARYVFSYSAKLAGSEGKRGVFEGVAVCELHQGLIASYREVANAATGLHMLGFSPERLDKIGSREVSELVARNEVVSHLDGC